jgi:Ca-activated chloride channel homolog
MLARTKHSSAQVCGVCLIFDERTDHELNFRNRETSTVKIHSSIAGCLFLLISLFFAPSNLHSQSVPPPLDDKPESASKIKMTVGLVVLRASAETRKGGSVSGLDKDNFQVFEDGVEQRIEHFSHEDIPVTVGLVVDGSGSMRPKRADVISAARAFVQSSNEKDEMFEVNFNEHVSFGLPEGVVFTNRIVPMQLAIERGPASGKTALYDAISTGLERLKLGKHDKKVLIVISDGGDNASSHNSLKQIMAQAVESNAVIYTVGLFDESDTDRNPGVLKQLARATGGEFFQPETIADVIPICGHIARDIRSQYTIAYTPTNKNEDGAFRTVQVRAKAQGFDRLTVRTRTGYYAPSAPSKAEPAKSSAPKSVSVKSGPDHFLQGSSDQPAPVGAQS